MVLKRRVRELIESLTNTHIFRTLPHGVDLFYDIKSRLPQYRAEVIFDVGANVGQSAEEFLRWFPESRMYCFEPVGSNFARLQDRLRGYTNVHCFRIALGASKSWGQILLQGDPCMYSLKHIPEELPISRDAQIENVEIQTLAGFCRNMGIEKIALLKIDTEGYDLEVLRGAGEILDKGCVDVVEVEAGMHPRNSRHIPIEELKRYFESRGYFLFGIYEQVDEWTTGEPHLRRSIPVFVSEHMREMNSDVAGLMPTIAAPNRRIPPSP